MKPSKHKMTVLSQIFKLIPRNLIPKLANKFKVDKQSRIFSPTSHVLALVFGQLTHALSLNVGHRAVVALPAGHRQQHFRLRLRLIASDGEHYRGSG